MWRKFSCHFHSAADPIGSTWTKHLVVALWTHTKSIWKYRNRIIHGHDIAEQKQRDRTSLMEQVEEAYATYNEDPFIIPRSMMYLFDKHILADR
jgi:hypothetical protein